MNDKKEEKEIKVNNETTKVVKETWKYAIFYRNKAGRGVLQHTVEDEVERLSTKTYAPGDLCARIADVGFMLDDNTYIAGNRVLEIKAELVKDA